MDTNHLSRGPDRESNRTCDSCRFYTPDEDVSAHFVDPELKATIKKLQKTGAVDGLCKEPKVLETVGVSCLAARSDNFGCDAWEKK